MAVYKRGLLVELRLFRDLRRPALAGMHELVTLLQEDESLLVVEHFKDHACVYAQGGQQAMAIVTPMRGGETDVE